MGNRNSPAGLPGRKGFAYALNSGWLLITNPSLEKRQGFKDACPQASVQMPNGQEPVLFRFFTTIELHLIDYTSQWFFNFGSIFTEVLSG